MFEQQYQDRLERAALVTLCGEVLNLDITNMTWEEVEEHKKKVENANKLVSDYLTFISSTLCLNSKDWTAQWELAEELFTPYLKDYHPEKIDEEALLNEFVEKGLNKTLAGQLVETIVRPDFS